MSSAMGWRSAPTADVVTAGVRVTAPSFFGWNVMVTSSAPSAKPFAQIKVNFTWPPSVCGFVSIYTPSTLSIPALTFTPVHVSSAVS